MSDLHPTVELVIEEAQTVASALRISIRTLVRHALTHRRVNRGRLNEAARSYLRVARKHGQIYRAVIQRHNEALEAYLVK